MNIDINVQIKKNHLTFPMRPIIAKPSVKVYNRMSQNTKNNKLSKIHFPQIGIQS